MGNVQKTIDVFEKMLKEDKLKGTMTIDQPTYENKGLDTDINSKRSFGDQLEDESNRRKQALYEKFGRGNDNQLFENEMEKLQNRIKDLEDAVTILMSEKVQKIK